MWSVKVGLAIVVSLVSLAGCGEPVPEGGAAASC